MRTGKFMMVFGAVMFGAVLGGCAALGLREPLNVSIAQFDPVEVGVLEQRYDVSLRLQNPTDSDLAFDGVVFEIELNGKSFATGVSNERGVVPRFGETLLSISAVSGLGGILRQVSEYQDGKRRGFSYRIKGRLNTAGSIGAFGGANFDSSGEFNLAGPAPKS